MRIFQHVRQVGSSVDLINADAKEVYDASMLAESAVFKNAKLECQLVEVAPEDVAISSWYRLGEDSAPLHGSGSARGVFGPDLDNGIPS